MLAAHLLFAKLLGLGNNSSEEEEEEEDNFEGDADPDGVIRVCITFYYQSSLRGKKFRQNTDTPFFNLSLKI